MIKKNLTMLILFLLGLLLWACVKKPEGEFTIKGRKSWRNKIEYQVQLKKTNNYIYTKDNYFFIQWETSSGRIERSKLTYNSATGYYTGVCFGLGYSKDFEPKFGAYLKHKKKTDKDEKDEKKKYENEFRVFDLVDQDGKKWPHFDDKEKKYVDFKDKTDNPDYDLNDIKEIKSVDDYLNIANNYNLNTESGLVVQNYKLVSDLDFKDKEFVPLAPRFAGWFDGNNKRIFNININTEKKNYISKEYGYKVDYEVQKPKFNKYVSFGLFDELLENSKVTDLVLEDITYDNSQVLYKDYEEVKEIKKFGLIAREIQKDAKITNITLNNISLTYLSHLPYAVENQSGLDTGAGLLCGVSKGEITNIHISNVKATFINRSNSGMAFGLVAGNATNIVQNITIKSSELNVLCDERRLLHMDKLETGSDKDDYKMADLKKFSGKKYNTYAGLVCGYMESSEETHFGYIYLKDNKVNFNTEEKTFQKDNEKEYFVTLLGVGLCFDFTKNYKEEYVKEDTSTDNNIYKVDNKIFKTYKYGEKAKVFFRRKMNYAKHMRNVYSGGDNTHEVKKITVGDKEYYPKDYKLDEKFEGYYYIEFEVRKNLEVKLHYTETFARSGRTDTTNKNVNSEDKEKNKDKYKDPFKNDKDEVIFEDITLNPKQDEYPYLTKLKFKYLKKSQDFKSLYAIATFDFAYEHKDDKKSENKEYEYKIYSRLDEDGVFELTAIGGRLAKLEVYQMPERNYYFGLVAGFAKNIASLYCENNFLYHVGDFGNLLKTDKVNEISTNKVNVGLYSANSTATYYNTISDNNRVLPVTSQIYNDGHLEQNLLEEVFNADDKNNFFKSISIINGEPIYSTLTNIDFNNNLTDKAKILHRLATKTNRELFFKELGISEDS